MILLLGSITFATAMTLTLAAFFWVVGVLGGRSEKYKSPGEDK